MAEMRDSSVLFSLNQLMDIEQERLREEQAAATKRDEAQRTAVAEQQRQVREAETARIRAEEERRSREEARAREEAARHEAMRLAAVERARAEAEQRGRIEAAARQQQHELSLAALTEDAGKKRLVRALVAGGLLSIVAIGGGLGLYFGKIKPEADLTLATQAGALARQEEETGRVRAELERQAKQVRAAEEAVIAARNDAEREKANRLLAEAKKAEAEAKKLHGHAAAPIEKKDEVCSCDRNDPMCFCLQ